MNLNLSQSSQKITMSKDHRDYREHSKSPDYTGQPIIRSQKNINSTSTFHIKTQNDRADDQPHRSPDIGRSDLRETWRRPRMPYNRLPQVFNNQQKQKTYPQQQKSIENTSAITLKPVKTHQKTQISQYKIININKHRNIQSHQNMQLHFFIYFVQKQEDKKKQTKQNGNPLNPVKKIMRMVAKLDEQIKEIQDISIDRYKNHKSGLKINQCVILEVIKRGHTTGTIKKMLHVPSLTPVCIREQPMTTKQSRNIMRDWMQFWREKLSGQPNLFVNIYQTIYGYPEGAISILMQYFKPKSLLNLLDLTATLPQSVIRQVFTQVLKCLDTYYSLTNMHFGGLSPSQIMITEQGTIKLSLGLFYHLPNLQINGIYNIRAHHKTNGLDFNNTFTKLTRTSIQKPINLDIQRSIDIFKLGLIMLNCAIGSFQNFQQSSYIFDNIKHIFTEHGQRQIQRDNVCCLIHSQQYLLSINPNTNLQSERVIRKGDDRFISYMKLLKDRFSVHFINFLCNALKLSHSKRSLLSQLNQSQFIMSAHDNQNQTVKIQLNDLLVIGKGWGQQIFQSGTHQKMGSFLSHLSQVLEECSKQTLTELLQVHRDRIYSVGKQIGINSQVMGKKLEEIIFEILRNMK